MAVVTSNNSTWWTSGIWNGTINIEIVCQQIDSTNPITNRLFLDSHYYTKSHSVVVLFQLTVILCVSTLICFILKPIRMPFISQILAGVLVAILFDHSYDKLLMSPPVTYSLKTFSFFGFILHTFMLGVETNRSVIKNIGKTHALIGITAILTSMVLASLAYRLASQNYLVTEANAYSLLNYVTFNATTYFMVICSHLNDFGISNSELGKMVTSIGLVLDLTSLVVSFLAHNVMFLIHNLDEPRPKWKLIYSLCYYFMVFLILRPLIIYIIKKTPEGKTMKQSHFLMIIMVLCFITLLGEIADQRFSLFLFAFSLPEEPLSTVLYEKMDTMTSGVFFPFFCAMRGMQVKLKTINKQSLGIGLVLLGGYVGKFLGALFASRIAGFAFPNATAIALILSSKGLLDVATVGVWRNRNVVDDQECTIGILYIIVLTGGLLPLIKYLFKPMKQYSQVERRNAIDNPENDIFQTLVCVYKEENVPGIVRLLEICHPSQSNHISAIALQLMNLTGRCSMPFMAPFHQVTSNSTFRSNLARCNRIMNAFLHLERESKGNTRIQHYIAVTPYATMFHDICRLAYEKKANLTILPFHRIWNPDGSIGGSSAYIRDVNKMVLEKAPCSVGQFVDKGVGSNLHISDNIVYRIALLFVGGSDDHEALEYSRIFANHPNIRLLVLWLKSPHESRNHVVDNEVMKQFRTRCKFNDRISFKEEVVKDGAETTTVVVTMKDLFDLFIVGKHHVPSASAVYGLNDGWTTMEYPELGIIGDILASSDFSFSVLVVQNEPQEEYDLNILNS